LKRALALIPNAAEQARGAFSGNVDVRVPAAKLRDVAGWEVSGSVTAQHLEFYGLALENTALLLGLHQGIATIQAAPGRLLETPITASAELRLAGAYPFTGKLSLQKADLAAFERLAPEVKPPFSLSGQLSATADFQGTLSPFVLETSGSGTADALSVEQLKVGTLSFHWASDLDRIKVTDVQAKLYGGELSGSSDIPLRATVIGNVRVRIQDLDVGAASKDVPNMPMRLEGRATGQLEGSLSAAEAGRPRKFTSKVELQAPQLRVQGIPTERLHGSVDYRDEAATYRFEGETLGGRIHLNGLIPTVKSKSAEPPEGHFRVEGAQLGRLAKVLGVRMALRSVQGVLAIDVTFRHAGPNREPIGSGRFSLDRVRWGETTLAGAIRGEVALTERELRARNISGEFAQGSLRGTIAVNLRQINRSRFALAFDQVEASRLLAPWPALAGQVEGPVQVRLRGLLGREWHGGGEIALAHGRVAGVEVLDYHLPFDWALAPGLGGGQVDIHESTAQLATGRVVSRASFAWGTDLRVEGQIRFFGLELRPFLRQVTELSQIGTGQVSGRFDFAGIHVRSFDDLSGTFDARLQQTQALQLPVLQQLTPFVLPGQSSAAVFQSGILRGRLGGGVFRIEQLTFAGNGNQLFVNGTASTQGRLNLEVTASSGNLGVNPAFLRFLGLRIPAVGPVPVALLMEASTYFSNRLVHLRVTGTVRSPIVSIQPLSLLTDEALRFFVNRANLPVP
jgi:translocation and assembly module TamB